MNAPVRNLGTIADDIARDRVAVIDLAGNVPHTLTYGDLADRACAVARGLDAAGRKPGDRIGILAFNRVDYITVLLGILRMGAIAVPLNVKLAAATLKHLIDAGEIAFLFYESSFAACIDHVDGAVCFDDESFEAFLDPGAFEPASVAVDSISMQPYTSGSTGLPKGVLLTHGGQDWAARTLVEHRRLTAGDRSILAAPMYHKNAIVAVKTALVSGGSMVVMSRFEADDYARTIATHEVNMLTGVPTMMRLLLDSPALPDASVRESVRVISMGSSPASDRLLADIASAFPAAEIHLNYGTTEGGPIMLGWYHPDGLPRPPHSIGYPIPGCEWRLLGDDPKEGELMVRNPGVARGYHQRGDATAERFIDGWYRTGDIIRVDDDGWFYFVARADDMINTGGENVFPQEVEAVLERHAEVRQAAVIGIDHDVKGQVPVAFVVLESGATAVEEELKRFALDNGPAYAHPRRVLAVTALPLTGTNKIDKFALAEIVAEATPIEQELQT